MGSLDPVKKRINNIRNKLAESMSAKDVEIMEDYTRQFWREELRYTIKEGKWDNAEKKIEEFLEEVQTGRFDSIKYSTLTSNKRSPKLEMELEEAKEILFLQILKWEKNLLEKRDRAIFRGDGSNPAPFSRGDAVEHHDEPLFILNEANDTYEVRGKEWKENSTFVTLSFARTEFEHTRKHLEIFKFALDLAGDVEVPEEEFQVAQEYEKEMEERVELLGKTVKLLENEESEKAEKIWRELMGVIKEEEQQI